MQKYSGRANYEGQMILLTPPKLIFFPRKFSMRAAKVRLHKRVILCDFAIRFRDTVERQRTYEVFKFMRRRLWTPHLLSGIEKQQLTPQSIFFNV